LPHLVVGELSREIDGVVLDKDGTLLDVHHAWAHRYAQSMRAVVAAANGDDSLAVLLHHALGLRGDGSFVGDSAIVSLKIADKGRLVANVLQEAGIERSRCLAIVADHMMPVLTSPSDPAHVRGIGDVRGRLSYLHSAGFHLAIATNDNRAGTIAEMRALGIEDLVDTVICADDDGLLSKPAPDGLIHIARAIGTNVSRLAMVGDTTNDMLTGRNAGAGLVVGVLSGLADGAALASLADVVVEDIHSLGSPA
jgi:phosphoglycolate phosphatase